MQAGSVNNGAIRCGQENSVISVDEQPDISSEIRIFVEFAMNGRLLAHDGALIMVGCGARYGEEIA